MHVIAVTSSFAGPLNVLLTFCIQKVCHWRELSLNFLSIKKSAISILLGILGVIFLTVLDVHIANNMVAQVVDNNHILNFAIFHHLIKDFLVEVLALSHSSIGISPADIVSINKRSLNCIVFVHVPQAYGLADRWLIMDTFAAVSVTTCTHFVEKWTIYFVHLCAVDLRKSVSH